MPQRELQLQNIYSYLIFVHVPVYYFQHDKMCTGNNFDIYLYTYYTLYPLKQKV